jgi:hypothetical protein
MQGALDKACGYAVQYGLSFLAAILIFVIIAALVALLGYGLFLKPLLF